MREVKSLENGIKEMNKSRKGEGDFPSWNEFWKNINNEDIIMSESLMTNSISISIPKQYEVDMERLMKNCDLNTKVDLLLKLYTKNNLVLTEEYLTDEIMDYVKEI